MLASTDRAEFLSTPAWHPECPVSITDLGTCQNKEVSSNKKGKNGSKTEFHRNGLLATLG